LRRFFESAAQRDPAARHLALACFFPEFLQRSLYAPAFAARVAEGAALDYFREAFRRAGNPERIANSRDDNPRFVAEGYLNLV